MLFPQQFFIVVYLHFLSEQLTVLHFFASQSELTLHSPPHPLIKTINIKKIIIKYLDFILIHLFLFYKKRPVKSFAFDAASLLVNLLDNLYL